ncbi:MAG TPA: L,D-transpeptidase [Polyangiaceae bacterium]|jgi:hypothetical protein|nr:L,D-transpeptidase [Polyangiaceae bacterium]
MRLLLLALTAALSTSALACATDDTATTSEEAYLKNAEKSGATSQKWIYEGPMPKLESPSIFVSLKANTLRITGTLPATYDQELPFYAKSKLEANGATTVTLVYPVATGKVDPSTGSAPMAPGHYGTLWGVPYTPTNDKADWGGFPFLKYHPTRGLAFHGPISSIRNADTGDWEWSLIRGPVSHGCERMQGEHVVELAHMLGMNMSGPHKSGDHSTITVSVDVSQEWDTYEGKYVDVDYPALASVQRPKTNVEMFPTWDSRNLPQIVCAYDSTKLLDGHHCADRGEIKQDLYTGQSLVEASSDPWIGTECAADADCDFDVDGEPARCMTSGGHGFCTVPCEGYCDDAPGAAPTFCAATSVGGRCMSKAAPENAGCADIAGTKAQPADRFVGKSGAAAKVATVCSF